MPDDQLDDLRHQRALIQEHLAWLDREIAALTPGAVAPEELPRRPAPKFATAPTAPRLVVPPSALSPSAAVPDFPELQADAATMQSDAKRGCLMYTVLAFAVFFAALATIYFVAYRDHPLFRAQKAPATAHPPR